MKLRALFVTIDYMHREMRELTLATGLKEEKYDEAVNIQNLKTKEEIKARYDFLKDIKEGAYLNLLRVWRWCTPEMWNMHDTWGHKHFPEQKELRKMRKILKQLWEDWYKNVKKEIAQRNADQATLETESL